MITIHDLKPGDIIILTVDGWPLHPAIYSPQSGEYSDLIQMGYGLKRSGAIKSTLSRQLQMLEKKKRFGFQVIRPKTIAGDAIAKQAEYWLRQGIVFDDKRLGNVFSTYLKTFNFPSIEVNIFEYLKFASRRETAPIKSHVYPYNYSSVLTLIGILFNTPGLKFSKHLASFGQKLIKKGTDKENRPKGLTCVGFVLSCIAAVALKDEINTVNEKTGWVSLKYSKDPDKTNVHYLEALHKAKIALGAKFGDHPGLDTLFTEEQLANFNVQRLSDKLTPLLANLNPHQSCVHMFTYQLKHDSENWINLGLLDKSVRLKEFDKNVYRQENKKILDDIKENREKFAQQFGHDVFTRNKKPTKTSRLYGFFERHKKHQNKTDERRSKCFTY